MKRLKESHVALLLCVSKRILKHKNQNQMF